MKPWKHLPTTFSVLLIAALLVACASPAVAPLATPVSLPATPNAPAPAPIPPTLEPAPVSTTEATAAAEPEPPHGIRFDAPEYAIDGPYAVGVRYFTIPASAETERELTVSVWYPAQKSDAATAAMVYEQQFAPGEIPAFTVLGHAQLDAPPEVSGAPYPLVVYSHSHWSFGQETPYFAEHLASRGLVVMSTDHEDNWSTAFGPIAPQAYFRRPQEITRQIDYAEHLSADGGLLPGFINTNQVGVAGWSQGAMTALAAAGARLNLANAAAWCQENPDTAELNTTACPDLVGREAELAAFADLDETPAGLWPDWRDERVGAVVAMAPSTIPFGKEGMQSVNVPVMFLIGSGETSVDGGFEMASPYESVVSGSKAKVVFDYGEHLMFFSSCADSPSIVELGFPSFCTDPVWDMDRAHDLINHFATAFLLAELKGDAAAAKALASENVAFPGITYEAAGYGAAPTAALDDATIAKIDAIVETAMTDFPNSWLRLEPMGMVNSTFVADEVDPELRVIGYISAEDGSAAAIEIAGDARNLPADGLWSNCGDMTQWAQFMLNKGELNGTRVLQPESIDAMWTSEAGTFWMDALGPWYGPYVGEYGLGWYVGEKAGHRLAGHAGAGDGVNTHIQLAPDDGLAVVAMDNWLKPDPDWYPAGFAAFDVMDLLLGLEAPAQ